MIQSESNVQIKELIKLQKNARERKKKKLFVAEGMKLTKEAAFHGKLKKIYIAQDVYEHRERELDDFLAKQDYEVVDTKIFRQAAQTVTPQGMLALVEVPAYSVDTLLCDPKRSFLLLDDLRDPGNLGTIMRTAEGAGMSGVILSRESVDLFNPKVVRATMGAIFRVPFYYADDLIEVIERLKAKQIPVYGTMMQGSEVYDALDYTNGAAIVIGNEANGISEEVTAHLTKGVRIPMDGSLESLNAAVAAAILMYETARQKRTKSD